MASSNTTSQLADGASSAFGHSLRQEFPFDADYRNFNQGSFGAWPTAIHTRLRAYQDRANARPDPFIRYELPKLLDASREVAAALLRAPAETVVLVPNATVAINTVLRNLTWHPDGRDVLLYFSTVYGGCGKTIDYIVDSHQSPGQPPLVSSREIPLQYPFEDRDALAAFEAAVARCATEGKRPRLCVFDTVSSLPGIRFPFEALTRACRAHGVLSLVDGAQGIGQIGLDLGALDPDFFLSNCHKWLFVPRGCAVLYVPVRHQGLIRSSVPTSHGYVTSNSTNPRLNPLPPSRNSPFVHNFEFTGTIDCSPYLCVTDALRWREEVLGGEAKILQYTQTLAREGGTRTAAILGTEVLENSTGTLGRCSLTNVALPIQFTTEGGAGAEADGISALSAAEAPAVIQWILGKLMEDYNTFIPLFYGNDKIWARMSAQVYLEMDDFEWAGRALLEICQRIAAGEHRGAAN
ncbi:Hercynylcysteine sulfoxide lyase [Apiospora phragmitis]|uniref:Hercynylcysteine sulfoxide lyase n=1 Tax=Apiospora phragmitis TaxID=2905665 RepID=A0ABR1T8G8_9PEZI